MTISTQKGQLITRNGGHGGRDEKSLLASMGIYATSAHGGNTSFNLFLLKTTVIDSMVFFTTL